LLSDRGVQQATQFSVGVLPPGYPTTLVPSGPVHIVGGMTSAAGEMIVVLADSTRRLPAVMEQLFEQNGFTRPPPSRGSGFSPGFGSSSSYFCKDSAMVLAMPLAGAERNFVRITYRVSHGRFGGCGGMRPSYATSESDVRLELPPLTAPSGVRVGLSGGGGSSSGVHSDAEMTGQGIVVADVLSHYSKQLVAAGWTASAPAIGERLAAQFFEAKDAKGGAWEGVLMVAGTATAIKLSLEMNPRSR
jgi:hypothetical protein